MEIVKKIIRNYFFRLMLFKIIFSFIFIGLLFWKDNSYATYFVFLFMLAGVFLEFKINYKVRSYKWWLLSDIFVLNINTILICYLNNTWNYSGYIVYFFANASIYLLFEFISYGIIRFFFTDEKDVMPLRFRDRFDKFWFITGLLYLIFNIIHDFHMLIG